VRQCLDKSGQPLPYGVDDLGRPLLQVRVHPVEEHSPHVVLMLVPGTVADAHRTRPFISRQLVEGSLAEVPLAADAVPRTQSPGLGHSVAEAAWGMAQIAGNGRLNGQATPEALIDHDGQMGSDGSKPRKPRRRMAKVPKYEEPNQAEGFTGGSFGRSGHGSDGHHAGKPGRAGSYLLKFLGKQPKP